MSFADNNRDQTRDELISELDGVREKARDYRSKLHAEAEEVKCIEDFAELTRKCLMVQPANLSLPSEDGWAWAKTRRDLTQAITWYNNESRISLDGTMVASSASNIISNYYRNNPSYSNTDSNGFYAQLNIIFDQRDWISDIDSNLRRLNMCEVHSNRRNPIELLNEARSSLANPSDLPTSPAAVLLPLRESINSIIAHLLRLRPSQEPASSTRDKVISILSQTKADCIEDEEIEYFAEKAHHVINNLSQSKQISMSRLQIQSMLNDSIAWLNSFLIAIDVNRIRKDS